MELDIYDFDKTIVPFDSGTLFVGFCLLHYPWCVITLPIIAVAFLLMLLRIINFTQFKKTCFMFLPLIPKKKAVKAFWDKHQHQVHPWFKQRQRFTVVISASPDFLLEEISGRLGFDKLICTKHNPKNGLIIGENCRGNEKVKRFYNEFDKNSTKVVDVYSDSIKHDTPIFTLATGKCYHIVNGEKIEFTL
jgi:phosphoserine phosphatase